MHIVKYKIDHEKEYHKDINKNVRVLYTLYI